MMIRALLFLFIGIFSSSSATADHVEYHKVRQFQLYWGGLNVGSLVGELKQKKEVVTFQTLIHSKGIAHYFSRYKCNAISHINASTAKAISFFAKTHFREKIRTINIDFNGETITSEAVVPPDNRAKRPEVPDNLKRNVFDPITLAFHSREKIRSLLKTNGDSRSFILPMYDGRRRDDLMFNIVGKKNITVRRQDVPVVHVQFKRKALAGLTQNEKRRLKEEEPLIDLYLSEVDDLIPVKAVARAPIGSAVAIMTKACKTLEECEDKESKSLK